MINASEIFSLCGTEGVPDVATSLAGQNIYGDISIPIFEGVYLKILPNSNLGFLCDNLQEAGVLQHLGKSCGTVGITLNILDMDILTLMGCVCAFTPRTGANVFFKNNVPDVLQLSEDIIENLAGLSHLPFDPLGGGGSAYLIDIASKSIDIIFDKLIDMLETDFKSHGIGIHEWEKLPEFRNELIQTGELRWMQRIRAGYQLPTI